MAKQILSQKRWYGGISDDDKDGGQESFFFGRGIDYRSEPSLLKALPETVKESGTTVVDLIKAFENYSTDIYGVGDTGKFYKRTSGGSWSVIDTLSTATGGGIGYFPNDDYIYLPKNSVIARYGPMGGTPALTQDYFSNGVIDLDQFLDSSGQVYATPTSIDEGATHRQSFAPLKDPQKSVQINISDAGDTANWTLTVHDAANVVVASKVLTNAEVAGLGDITFTFATAWRPIVGAEYHFHVTTNNTTGAPAVVTGTASDLETADYHTFYQILVTDTGYHPVLPILTDLAIGNGQYVATYNGYGKELGATVYDPHRLELYRGWKCRDFVLVGEYMAIVAWQGAAVTDVDKGMIYLWDGFSDSPNFVIDVDDGTVLAAAVVEKTLLYITSSGTVYSWDGNSKKLKTLPKMTQQTFIDVFPGAFKVWRGLPVIGIAGDSDSTVLEKGVYSFGRTNERYPVSLNYDYPISTGTRTGTGLDIGAIAKKGQALLVAWKDSSSYGVDVVSATAEPFGTSLVETRIIDCERPDKEKLGLSIKVTHRALKTGESITLHYDVNRSGTYTDGSANSTVGSTKTVLQLDKRNNRFYELQIKVTLASGATSPKVLSANLYYDDLVQELRFS